jgi:hypothetical protein
MPSLENSRCYSYAFAAFRARCLVLEEHLAGNL